MRWAPVLADDQCTLVTFGTSQMERLLVAIDSSNTVHVALMTEDAGAGMKPVDLYSIQLFSFQRSNILSCSIAVRCGVLAFVEAADLEAQYRLLHVWQLLARA